MDYACNNYKNNDSKECAEFVSDCLKYGGLPISGSKSCSRLVEQLGALGLVRYELTKRSNGVVYYSDNIGKIEEGDPIFWYCNNCGVYPHAVLCYSDEKTNKDGKVYYCGHNNSNINSPLNNSCLCWGCKNPLIFYSYHIPNASTEYGRINVTIYKDGSAWHNPDVANKIYVQNTATGAKTYLNIHPDYDYVYRTGATLPYGTYKLYMPSGSGTIVDVGQRITLDQSSLWVGKNYYTVNYHPNGGSGSSQTALTRLVGQTVTISSNRWFSRPGYLFVGWGTSASGGTIYQPNSTITVNAKVNLYAQWQAQATAYADVRLDGQSWAGEGRGMALKEANNEDACMIPLYYESGTTYYATDGAVPCVPYDVYVSLPNGDLYKSGGTFNMTQSSNRCTVNFYTVDYDPAGGGVPFWEEYAADAPSPVPSGSGLSKSGYTFCYWYNASKPTVPHPAGSSYTVKEACTLKARWISGNYALGDVDRNGSVDSSDSRMVLQYTVGNETFDSQQKILADYNCDGAIDSTDSSLILQAAVARALSMMRNSALTWDDLDWDRLDIETIDWDSLTLESLLAILTDKPIEEIQTLMLSDTEQLF